ncbi:MAM and LDL-receptor class A domain-containing protein 1-like [Anneissia japonica]|uniref:MAM and LDL-receptor class A domain-containing protein 1-like n=1 Tax=Anneissia japonica TaxID=1529436 RepID=UPI0014258E5B|nr:MAM and LDL-receptor class A domain-containing protein 1-like [Anneissia japonica]
MALQLRSYVILILSATSVHQSKAQNVYCDFESHGACGYSKGKSGIGWKRIKSNNLALEGVIEPPPGDHTTGKGYFMHVMKNDNNNGNKKELTAQLMSPWEAHRQDFFTLEFYYLTKVEKSLDCELRIHVNNVKRKNNTLASWRRPCVTSKSSWKKASVLLFSETMFQIVFEVIFRGNAQVAIDDVSIVYDDIDTRHYTKAPSPTMVSKTNESTISIISLVIGIVNMMWVICAVGFIVYTKRHGHLPRIFEHHDNGTYTSLRREHASKPVACVTYEVPADKMKESNYSFDIPAMHGMKRADSGLTEDQDGSECIGSSNYLNLARSNDYIYQVVQSDSTLVSISNVQGVI